MNEVAKKFGDNYTRIEYGKINEPVAIYLTHKFPTPFFQISILGLEEWEDPEGISEGNSCNKHGSGYGAGTFYECSSQCTKEDCVLIRTGKRGPSDS